MFDRFEFLIGEAIVALRRNGWMAFAAVSTVAVSLFLLGGLAFAYMKASDFAEKLPGKFEMRVHLRMNATADDIKETAAQIRALDGVQEASWIPRDKQWEVYKEQNPSITAGIEENPLPDAFKVVLNDLSKGDAVAENISRLRAVAEGPKGVVYLRQEQQFVQDLMTVFRNVGGALAVLLTVTAWILIYNAIRLTVQARRLEIRIMQLVGASRLTVQIPFMIEGIIHGILGGVAAAVLLQGAYTAFGQLLANITASASLEPFPLGTVTVALCGLGIAYGLVCSAIAVRRPLRYR
jgi:cell division transport system permease protein